MEKKTYTIYSHCDADGGIAAAIFARFLQEKYNRWSIDIEPVNHAGTNVNWHLKEIFWPCAILDFSLHPSMLSEKFFSQQIQLEQNTSNKISIPKCYWLDHHPTGSNFPFLQEDNIDKFLPCVITKWDTKALSTPGLLRTHYEELQLPKKLIAEYEEFIDLAEIIDGALYASCEDAYDYSSDAVKLQSLFNSSHKIIDKNLLYKKLAKQIIKSASVEELFDSDFLYQALILHEEQEHKKRLQAYRDVTVLHNKVTYTKFLSLKNYFGLGRFIPYLYYPSAQYSVHLLPKGNDAYAISCGINPWNKPIKDKKHLGNYFAKYFSGGGHAFVAGGRINASELNKIDKLIDYLNLQ